MKKRRVLMCTAVAVLICIAALGWWQWNKSRELPTLMEKIGALPVNATAEELEREGFLNLTEVQTGPVKEVTQFMQGQKHILSYFIQTENGPLIHILSEDNNRLLAVYTYSVQEKTWQYPNTGFSFRITYQKEENGVTEVWIHSTAGTPEEDSIPNWTDYLLYRYL